MADVVLILSALELATNCTHAKLLCIDLYNIVGHLLIIFVFAFTASKQSDLDIIFGDGKTATAASSGNGKYTRSGGSISDADMIFGGPPSNYKTDRFGASKSMSMSSSGVGASSNSYKIYEGIQNAAFSDFSDTGSVSSVNSTGRRWNAKPEEEDELDLK